MSETSISRWPAACVQAAWQRFLSLANRDCGILSWHGGPTSAPWLHYTTACGWLAFAVAPPAASVQAWHTQASSAAIFSATGMLRSSGGSTEKV